MGRSIAGGPGSKHANDPPGRAVYESRLPSNRLGLELTFFEE